VDYLRIIRKYLDLGGVFYYNTTESDDVLHPGTTGFRYALRVVNFLRWATARWWFDQA
jgi:hypothetical protein